MNCDQLHDLFLNCCHLTCPTLTKPLTLFGTSAYQMPMTWMSKLNLVTRPLADLFPA